MPLWNKWKNNWKCSEQNQTLKARDSSLQKQSIFHILPTTLELDQKYDFKSFIEEGFFPSLCSISPFIFNHLGLGTQILHLYIWFFKFYLQKWYIFLYSPYN